MNEIKVEPYLIGDAHLDSKFIFLKAYIDGKPELTKTTSINRAGIGQGKKTVREEARALKATLRDYLKNWEKSEEELKELRINKEL